MTVKDNKENGSRRQKWAKLENNNPHGAAQQRPPEEITAPALKLIEEEVKEPEPPQTVELAVEAATSAPSVDSPPRVIQ